jgi:hypothetical protein
MLVAIIAVAGTLLGSALTHFFQRHQNDVESATAAAEARRQERITAYSEFAAAVAQLRGACQNRYTMRVRHGSDSEQHLAARTHTFHVQPAARAAMYRVLLLADDPRLLSLAADIMETTISIREAETDADMERRSDLSRMQTEEFIAAAAAQLNGTARNAR